MRYGTRWKVAAGAAALAMLVTACGDDDEDEATSDTTAAAEEGPDSEYCRLAAEFDQSEGIPTIEEQKPAYEQINKDVMDFLPGVPLAHPVPSLAFAPEIQGYQQSPVQDEVWNVVSIEE